MRSPTRSFSSSSYSSHLPLSSSSSSSSFFNAGAYWPNTSPLYEACYKKPFDASYKRAPHYYDAWLRKAMEERNNELLLEVMPHCSGHSVRTVCFEPGCLRNYSEAVEMALYHPDLRFALTNLGGTPLMMASFTSSWNVVNVLLADPWRRSYHGSMDIDGRKAFDSFGGCGGDYGSLDKRQELALRCSSHEYFKGTGRICHANQTVFAQAHAGHLFALSVLRSDGYLQLTKMTHFTLERRVMASRFFTVLGKLPQELQMMICNTQAGLSRDLITSKDLESGLRRVALHYHYLEKIYVMSQKTAK